MKRTSLYIGLASLLWLGCQPTTVGEVIHKLRADAYVRTLKTGNHKIDFRFVPETLYYLTFNAANPNRPFNPKLLDSLNRMGLTYGLMFSMTIAPRHDTLAPTDYRDDLIFGQTNGEDDYRKALNKFTFGLSQKIWLEIGGKHYAMKTYQMTNSWGMDKSRTFTLVFGPVAELIPKKKGEVDLVVEDMVPGQGRDKICWKFPMSKYDFI